MLLRSTLLLMVLTIGPVVASISEADSRCSTLLEFPLLAEPEFRNHDQFLRRNRRWLCQESTRSTGGMLEFQTKLLMEMDASLGFELARSDDPQAYAEVLCSDAELVPDDTQSPVASPAQVTFLPPPISGPGDVLSAPARSRPARCLRGIWQQVDILERQQRGVRGHQREFEHLGRGHQKSIDRVTMSSLETSTGKNHFPVERRFNNRAALQRLPDPVLAGAIHPQVACVRSRATLPRRSTATASARSRQTRELP